jgi:uncharacterized Zn finger protein (UPF0148 family)
MTFPSEEQFNEYGHTPCPQCGMPWRYMTTEHENQVFCPECTHLEPATRNNSNEDSAAEFE